LKSSLKEDLPRAKNKGNGSNWWASSWYLLCIWNA